MRPNDLLIFIIVQLVELSVPHRQVVVHLDDLRVHTDEISEDLLDLLIVEGFLDEPFEVVTEVSVLLKCILDLIKIPLRVSLILKIDSV